MDSRNGVKLKGGTNEREKKNNQNDGNDNNNNKKIDNGLELAQWKFIYVHLLDI